MTDKTTEAIDRMKKWLWASGDRSNPQFVADLKTLIRAAQNEQRQELVRRCNEQRQELVRRFAVAIVQGIHASKRGQQTDTSYVWRVAADMADTEPPTNP